MKSLELKVKTESSLVERVGRVFLPKRRAKKRKTNAISLYFRHSFEIVLILFDSDFLVRKTFRYSFMINSIIKLTATVFTQNWPVLFSFQRVSRNIYTPSRFASWHRQHTMNVFHDNKNHSSWMSGRLCTTRHLCISQHSCFHDYHYLDLWWKMAHHCGDLKNPLHLL